MEENLTEIENVECIGATANAVKVRIKEEDIWIPRSLLRGDNEIKLEGDKGKLIIPTWKAKDLKL